MLPFPKLTAEQLSMLFGAIDGSTKLKNLVLRGIDLSSVGHDILAAAGINQLKTVRMHRYEMNKKQIEALLTQAGKKTNLEHLTLHMSSVPGMVVDKDIVRLAKMNIRDLKLMNITCH